ncbi:MAG: hypothetical protein WDA21_04270 [Bacilli bacterium]
MASIGIAQIVPLAVGRDCFLEHTLPQYPIDLGLISFAFGLVMIKYVSIDIDTDFVILLGI